MRGSNNNNNNKGETRIGRGGEEELINTCLRYVFDSNLKRFKGKAERDSMIKEKTNCESVSSSSAAWDEAVRFKKKPSLATRNIREGLKIRGKNEEKGKGINNDVNNVDG